MLTGFLGPKKTAMINYLLKNDHNEKIIIIENEYEQINIDNNLLNISNEIQIVEITNDCICYNIRNQTDKCVT
ncbi:GTP-binding protein [Gilliamella sp. wkB18]|uniref:GTP-binding protein n=1 Tax=Gilliamella sp. wkB18 TaxID=3120260 RepID=UPI003FA5F012